ncbi:monofunctional biosynthetic peptidoglycan transglycosylase [Jannaschia marina]|uniref:monofunctional biosynthetic peptidoglycan transglycosylase n=1 Tax=Jannaschia marina TaxID=2741674 RepID=UPI0015CA13AE|nr:monofunctional biosynthetic peptidoglycan transglycosylase [Jannaschia marina]
MAKTAKKKSPAKRKTATRKDTRPGPLRRLLRWVWRALFWGVVAVVLWVLAYRWIDPPVTPYMLSERMRLGALDHEWVDLDDMVPVMARAAVAAEDANFCAHWGFDVTAIREAIEAGGTRGASTISQQVVKNAFLWQGRSWPRKALEAGLTPLMEALWPKRRVVEVYLNVAEFDEGVFGVQAAARRYFGVDAADLSTGQAAALASILPNPKVRDAAALTPALQRKARRVRDGAATIRADGRAACFED